MSPNAVQQTRLDTIGHRARYARTCRGYTRRVFGKYVRASAAALASYEQGFRSWPHELLVVVAYALDVPLRWLQEGEGEVPIRPMSPEEELRLGRMPAKAREAGLRARMRLRPVMGKLRRL